MEIQSLTASVYPHSKTETPNKFQSDDLGKKCYLVIEVVGGYGTYQKSIKIAGPNSYHSRENGLDLFPQKNLQKSKHFITRKKEFL